MMRGTTLLLLVLGCAALAGATALEAIRSTTGQELAGTGDAYSRSLIEIIEVDSIEHLHGQESLVPDTGDPLPPRLQSFDEVKRRMDNVYAPSYLPEGFALRGSRIGHGFRIRTVYSSDQFDLNVMQDSYPAQPRVKRGYVETVSINGRPAYLIKGAWVQVVKDGNVSAAEWDPDIMLSVILQIDDYWFLVEAMGLEQEDALGKTELLRVAESIQLSR